MIGDADGFHDFEYSVGRRREGTLKGDAKIGETIMPPRREFGCALIGTGAAAALAADPQPALGQSSRKRLIVDAQIHLWKAESEDWKWVPGAMPHLPEPFTIERVLSMMDEAGVDRR